MLSGIYDSAFVTEGSFCYACDRIVAHSTEHKVWLEADPTNPQLPPKVFHIPCAVTNRLDHLEREFRRYDLYDFGGKMKHRRCPYELWEMVRDHLMTRFKLPDYEAEHLLREWANNT